jgi:hypothetical protein
VLEVGSGTKFQLLSLFNIVGPLILDLTRNLGVCERGISTMVEEVGATGKVNIKAGNG